MKPSEVEFIDNQMIIYGNTSPLVIRIVFGFFLAIAILIPFFAIGYRLTTGLGLHFGFLIIFIVCGGIAYFFLKTLLWNTYGKETLTFSETTITYIADYKYFKSKTFTVTTEDFELTYGNKEKDTYVFVIENEAEFIQSVLPISMHHILKLQQKLDVLYGSS
jgi:hypothetical protein